MATTTPSIEALIAEIKQYMPETYKSIKERAYLVGNDTYTLVRRGLRGEPNCFYCIERGRVMGTPFAVSGVTDLIARQMVEFGCGLYLEINKLLELLMARIEYIKHRLENWALWKERDSGGGLGFATRSVLLCERVDRYREIDIRGTIDDTDASLTNSAVESLRPARKQLYDRLYLIYINGLGIKEAARRECCAPSTISASLEQADHALQAWFSAHVEMQKKRSSTT